MATLLKDLYSPAFYDQLSAVLLETVPGFDKVKFIQSIFTEGFDAMELKERMRHTTKVLHHFFPASFAETKDLIVTIIARLQQQQGVPGGLEYIFFPDYIETYGINDYENAVKAIEAITQFITCEFAVRPFLLKYDDRMIQQMITWSMHENHKVRRLASEGTRPRLPWAMALPQLKKDPAPLLPLLENLKNDPSEFVRRSVANNLNDIAKDNPDIVIDIARQWKGQSKETDAIIKHGCRTLLKQGHKAVLNHYGLQPEHISISALTLLTPRVKIGGALTFSFTLVNHHSESQTVRLEYAIYYKRKSNQLSKKVFKISEKIFAPHQNALIKRSHSFRPITTRVFYEGEQQLSIIINGEEKEVLYFDLVK